MPRAKPKVLKYMAVADRNSGEELIIGQPYRHYRDGSFSVTPICRYNLATGEAVGTMPPPPLHRARGGDIYAVAETFLGIVIQVERLRNKIKASEAPTT